MAQKCPKMTQNSPKWPKYDSKWPKMTQNYPKLPPNGPKMTPGFTHFFCKFFSLKKRFFLECMPRPCLSPPQQHLLASPPAMALHSTPRPSGETSGPTDINRIRKVCKTHLINSQSFEDARKSLGLKSVINISNKS